MPQIRPAMHPLFRDVTDHIRRVQEKIDALREVLAFAFEASVLMGQSQETAITKKLASWAAILAVPTALAGIYGMNFENMPELKLPFGYYTVIAVIAAVCAVLYWRFRQERLALSRGGASAPHGPRRTGTRPVALPAHARVTFV